MDLAILVGGSPKILNSGREWSRKLVQLPRAVEAEGTRSPERINARWMTHSSSRTLPGHSMTAPFHPGRDDSVSTPPGARRSCRSGPRTFRHDPRNPWTAEPRITRLKFDDGLDECLARSLRSGLSTHSTRTGDGTCGGPKPDETPEALRDVRRSRLFGVVLD